MLVLIIEVDGITHHFDEVIEKDIKKTKDLTAAGFTVYRFTDEEVLNDIENVKRKLKDYIERFEKKLE